MIEALLLSAGLFMPVALREADAPAFDAGREQRCRMRCPPTPNSTSRLNCTPCFLIVALAEAGNA